MIADRGELLSPYMDVAAAGAALDALLAKVTPGGGKAADWQLVDRALVLETLGLSTERAETAQGLVAIRKEDGAAFYGGALLAAGDAWLAETVLWTVIAGGKPGQDALLDLMDSILDLDDARMMAALAAAVAMTDMQPQQARTLSELLRGVGDIDGSDRLFAAFIDSSGLGAGTRFNWEGSRLLAEYYLDTGRLEMGRRTAETALSELIDQQAGRATARSPQPEKFASLFGRFDGLERMLEIVRAREKDLPDNAFMSRLEEVTLIRLGRADEALAAVERAHAQESAIARKIALAAANADMGRADEAAGGYEEAIAADPNAPPQAYLALAALYADMGRPDDAQRLLMSASRLYGVPMEVAAGGFFAGRGDDARASIFYKLLDDLSRDVGDEALGEAVRFFAGRGEADAAARALARRAGVSRSFDEKAAWIVAALPRSSASAAAYLEIGKVLGDGALAYDHQLLALYYRELSARGQKFLDGVTVQEAARRAVAEEPDSPQNLAQFATVADSASTETYRARLSLYARVPTPDALIALAGSELARGEGASAASHVTVALALPLRNPEVSRLIRLLEESGEAAALAPAAAAAGSPAWPWVYRARLAAVASRAGQEALAVSQAQSVVEGGPYIGRGAWGTGFYLRARAGGRAQAIATRFEGFGDRPEVRLMGIAVERFADSSAAARVAADEAARVFARPPFSTLFNAIGASLITPEGAR